MEWPQLCTTRLLDQNFGTSISPQDILVPFFNNHRTNYYRPWKLCEELATKDYGSTVENTNDKFTVTLDVQHFLPNEITVKVNNTEIIVEGKHEERKDDHGMVSRQFMRRYALPINCISDSVASTLSSDGVLTITASKSTPKKIGSENIIPIKMCGPSRATNETGSKVSTEEVTKKCVIKDKQSELKLDKSEKKNDTNYTTNEMCDIKNKSEVTSQTSEINSAVCANKNEKCEIKSDIEKTKNDSQTLLKEEHCRLLKPELLSEAVSGTEKLLSESRKETDELLKLISADKTVLNSTTGKLEDAIGQCKAVINDLKKEKEKLTESSLITMSETSSMKSSMMSETIEMSMASSAKASTSQKISDAVSEIISAELQEAAQNI